MGMGYCGAFSDTVEQDFVKKICPDKFQALIEALDANPDMTLENFAQTVDDVPEKETADIYDRYNDLCCAFEKKTGLSLSIGYHDSENNGDRYDEINGVFWSVGEVYQLTPAGKKYKKNISRKFFVQFG